jgi:hypothetical protein
MTRDQEDRIIKQAQDILERRLAVENEIKVSAQNVIYYGAYYSGALASAMKIIDELKANKPRGEDWIYKQAEWDLITKSKRNMQLFLDGQEARFRNHKRNKKGKLESCEMYFVERRTLLTELK